MAFAFLDTLISPLLEVAGGEWLKNRENRKKFENDLKLFLGRQSQDTHLDIFKFAERPEIRQDEAFLPLESVYVPMRLKQTHELKASREHFMEHFQPGAQKDKATEPKKLPEDVDIATLLRTMHRGEESRKVLLIGNGGSGKSTFSKYIARFFTSDDARKVRVLKKEKDGKWTLKNEAVPNQYFPVFLRLRDLEGELKKYAQADWADNFSVERFFTGRYNLAFETPNFYGQLFRYFPCLFLLDGVDEVPEYKDHGFFKISRPAVIQWLTNQVGLLERFHHKTAFVLTSRPTDLSLLARHFAVYEVQAFNDAEIRQFTQYWYSAYEKSLHFVIDCEPHLSRKTYYQKRLQNLPENRASFEKNLKNRHLKDLISSPLLLSQAVLIHSIDDRFEIDNIESLYQKFVQTLLYRWDEVRQMSFYPELLGSANVDNMYKLLRRLAFFFSQREATKLPVREFLPDMVHAIERFKGRLPHPEKVGELSLELLRVFRDRSGILTGSMVHEGDFLDTEFEFQHKSIQDYLTAATLADDSLLQNNTFELHNKVGTLFWDRTIEFYVNLGNPDFFFKDYIGRIKPRTDYAGKMNYVTQYMLLAREKSPDIESELVKSAWAVLREANRLREIEVSAACLSRINASPILEVALENLKHPPETFETGFRQGKIAQMLWMHKRYDALRPVIRQSIEQASKQESIGARIVLSGFSPIILLSKDYTLIRRFLEAAAGAPPVYQINALEHLQDLWNSRDSLSWGDLQDLQDLLDSLSLRNLRNSRDSLSWGDLRYLRDLQDLRYLRYFEDLLDWLDWLDWRDLRYLRDLREKADLQWAEKYNKIRPKLQAALTSVLKTLQDLPEDKKRAIFNYVDA